MASGTLKFNGAIKLGQLASAPLDPAAGMLYYDSSLGELRYHNGTTFTELANFTQLGVTGASSGALTIGTASTWSNITPSANNVEKVLEAIDSFLGTVSGSTPTDGVFRIENSGDNSKKIAFSAAGITTATTRTITMPDANVDLGNLTNSNISASAAIAYSKLNLSGSILNADINTSAAISYSKLSLTGSIVNGDINSAAAIAYSKLALSASIVNADIASAAAIALNKLAALTNHNRALQSDASGFVSESSVTSTELGYVSGVTSAIQTQLNATEKTANKGANNGYASLDGGGKVPLSQLPATVLEYLGTWDASANTPTLADGTGTSGQFYITQTAGTQNLGSGSQTFAIGDWVMYDGSIWERVINSNAVASVNGQTGAVTINAINQLTGDITAGPASGSQSKAATIAAGAVTALKLGTVTDGVTLDQSGSGSTLEVKAGGISNTQISSSAAIAYSKLALSGSIVNADINSSAAIAYSKLALSASIVNADISGSAAIAYSKLALALSIVNGDISASAAIAYSKLALSNSIVNADVATGAAIAYAKLNLSASIVNADIASGAAIALAKLAALTANRALISDGSGVVAVSAVTNTELGFVSGVTSSIQTQINAKISSVSNDTAPTLGGNLSMGGFSIISPFQIADAGSTSRFFTEKYIDATSLTASTTAVASNFTFDSRNFKGVEIFYNILSGTDRRIGKINITCDQAAGTAAAAVDVTDQSNETADVGVTWSAAISGNNVQVSYTTGTGTKTMRALMRLFQA